MRSRRQELLAAVVAAILGALVTAAALASWVAVERSRSARRAELAQRFALQVRDAEWQLRVAQMSPRHDLTADRARVERQLLEIEQAMRELGAAAAAPGHYAVGRGLLALGDHDAALPHLEKAWELGLRSAEIAFARGVALGELYRQEVQWAQGVGDEAQRLAALDAARQRWREPALAALREGRSSASSPLIYVDALIALFEERFDEALELVDVALVEAPWLWEARMLEGEAHRHRANVYRHESRWAEMEGALAAADEAFEKVIAVAPSAAAGYAGLCANGVHRMFVALHAPAPDAALATSRDRTLEACGRLGEVRPDHPEVPLHRANVHGMLARRRQATGDAGVEEAFREALHHGERAVAVASRRSLPAALRAVGDARLGLGRALLDHGAPASEHFAAAAAAFQRSAELAPTASAYNNAANAYFFLFQEEQRRGGDPLTALDRAAALYGRTIELAPGDVLAVGNLALVQRERARWRADRGADVREDLAAAAARVEQQLARAPENPWLLQLAAGTEADRIAAASRHGDMEAAAARIARGRELAERAVAVDPAAYAAWWARGNVELAAARHELARGGDPEPAAAAAEAAFVRHAELRPRQGEPWGRQARVHWIRARVALAAGGDPLPHVARGVAATDAGLEREPTAGVEILPERAELLCTAVEAAPRGPQALAAAAQAWEAARRLGELRDARARDLAAVVCGPLWLARLTADPASRRAAAASAQALLARAYELDATLRSELAELQAEIDTVAAGMLSG